MNTIAEIVGTIFGCLLVAVIWIVCLAVSAALWVAVDELSHWFVSAMVDAFLSAWG